jgi:UDP-N-acetyl-2-amino-2-deoxyglucuronate dehydrogenase
MKIGLTGGGNISNTHARAARAIAGVEIAAVYGTNADKVNQLSREHNAVAYSDFQAFLAHPMDMVIVGGPSGLHATQGIAAAQQGLHVLVEKPIDVCTQRADALISNCQKAGVKLGVIFQDRFQPDICRLRHLIQQGRLGRPWLVDARVKWYRPPEYYRDSRWRGTWALDGGGALINQGVHTIDLLLWLLGDIKIIAARTATLLHQIETEDTALAQVEFSNGALGTFQATTAAFPGYPRRVEITGSEGTVVLENDAIVRADLRGEPAVLIHKNLADQNPSSSSPVVSDFRGHQLAIEDFIRAIKEDGTPCCDGEAGRRSVAAIEEIYRLAGSAQT